MPPFRMILVTRKKASVSVTSGGTPKVPVTIVHVICNDFKAIQFKLSIIYIIPSNIIKEHHKS